MNKTSIYASILLFRLTREVSKLCPYRDKVLIVYTKQIRYEAEKKREKTNEKSKKNSYQALEPFELDGVFAEPLGLVQAVCRGDI